MKNITEEARQQLEMKVTALAAEIQSAIRELFGSEFNYSIQASRDVLSLTLISAKFEGGMVELLALKENQEFDC